MKKERIKIICNGKPYTFIKEGSSWRRWGSKNESTTFTHIIGASRTDIDWKSVGKIALNYIVEEQDW